MFTTPNGQRGAMLRAYDKATGKEVGEVYMPGAQTGSPMTYMLNGKQYIVVAVSGAVVPGEIMAFALAREIMVRLKADTATATTSCPAEPTWRLA